MPLSNSIVGRIEFIEPAVDGPGDEMFRRYPDGFSVGFEDKQTTRLRPGEFAAGTLEILEELRRMGAPAFVEVDPDSQSIARLLIPLVVTVDDIHDAPDSDELLVELQISHARHSLSRKNPHFAEMIEILQAAQKEKSWVAVTEAHEHEIIDVRHYPEEPRFDVPALAVPRPGLFYRFRCWLCGLWRCLCCTTAQHAKDLFDMVAATTCAPLTVPPPCIPFLYPDDGCWGRAHEMCRLIIAAGAKPKKVWIYGSLHTPTRNNPNCIVNWGWHVAPTLCVRTGFCRTEDRVIDPALFQEPVSKTTWKGVQGDPGATLVDTDASVFYRSYSGTTITDPTYSETAIVLATYRLHLKNRSLAQGPPPYAQCP